MYEKVPGEGGRGRAGSVWKRRPIPESGVETVVLHMADPPEQTSVLEGRAILHVNARTWDDTLRLVTMTLVNSCEGKKSIDPGTLLFQVGLSVESREGEFMPYPQPPSSASSDEEEAEVRYLYRDSPVYARGHGAAAMWDVGVRPPRRVWAEFMPSAVVRAATFEISAGKGLDPRYRDLDFLAFCEDDTEVRRVLGGLAEAFGEWIEQEEQSARDAGEAEGIKLAKRCRDWCRRMREGIECLSDPLTFRAFQIANQAMLWQMRMGERAKEGPFKPDEGLKSPALEPGRGHKWRPFQVASCSG